MKDRGMEPREDEEETKSNLEQLQTNQLPRLMAKLEDTRSS
jgi:hypothetical protein